MPWTRPGEEVYGRRIRRAAWALAVKREKCDHEDPHQLALVIRHNDSAR